MDFFDDRIYLDLSLSKAIQTDAKGNYIIEAEASNENLDFQGQIVLQRALLDSKKYFLDNGVISWDHLHQRKGEDGSVITDPRYIIGEPLSVEKRGSRTFVKAILYKGNDIAEDIVKKLEDGSTIIHTSVGGRKPIENKSFDGRFGRVVGKVTGVLWDELAMTYKPVNQTLSPVALSSFAFVKSLEAGYSTDSATATGGAALVTQDLEGAKGRKKGIHALVTAVAVGDVGTPDAAAKLLAEYGIKDNEATDILRELVSRRKQFSEVFKMDGDLAKSFDDSIEELQKALGFDPKQAPAPAPAPKGKGKPEGEDDPDGDDDEGEDGLGEGSDELPPAAPPAKVKKSVEPEPPLEGEEFLDVSPILSAMSKSIQDVHAENKKLRKLVSEQSALLKSIGNAQLQSSIMLKSISEIPAMRKSVIDRNGRFGKALEGAAAAGDLSPAEISAKVGAAVRDHKLDYHASVLIENRIAKGIPLDEGTMALVKSL
jgi:hypothetical protein